MRDAHDLGSFDTLEKVWDAYPYGGCPGDYVTIGGEIVRWNDGRRVWGNSGDDISSTETQHVEGNLIVDENLTVGGKTKGDAAEFKKIKVETLEVKNPPYALKEHEHDEEYAAKVHKHELKDVIGAGDGVVIPGKIEYAKHADSADKADYADKAYDIDEDSPVNDRFVSAIHDDKAAGLIQFLKGLISKGLIKAESGLEVGEAIDSLLAGKGIIADNNGRIQASRVEIRDSLTVLRLIINDLQAMSGDYSFSDCGHIEKVDNLGDGTYKLWMEKRTDTDWTTLDVNDVLFSIVNTLLVGGTDYYKSWFRTVSKNRNDNTLTVVLYPDSEVPGGKNYPPAAGYNVARHGNAIIPDAGDTNERAQSWMISSREGRMTFLQNMFKPIIEDYNYALSIGKFPNLKALERLPLSDSDTGIYAKNIVAENFYKIDYNGDIVPSKVDRGEWSLEVAESASPYRNVATEKLTDSGTTYTLLEQHTVTYYGCTWGCLIDKTILEPAWNSPAWAFLGGDPNYYLSFTIPGGTNIRINQVDLTVTACMKYANRDITDVLIAAVGTEVEWLRDTKNAPADNMWKPTYVNGQKNVIHIDNSNDHGVGKGFGIDYREVVFICRVFIPIGDKLKEVKNSIGLKI